MYLKIFQLCEILRNVIFDQTSFPLEISWNYYFTFHIFDHLAFPFDISYNNAISFVFQLRYFANLPFYHSPFHKIIYHFRYLAICRPLAFPRRFSKMSRAILALLAIWIASISFSLPWLFFNKVNFKLFKLG